MGESEQLFILICGLLVINMPVADQAFYLVAVAAALGAAGYRPAHTSREPTGWGERTGR